MNPTSGEPIIKVRQLRKTFKRAGGDLVHAIDGTDLDVHAGEMVVLLGPSGCGKTTLLRCIGGLEQPDEGSIDLLGVEVFGPSRRAVPPEHRNVGMMFQSYALWPHMTVYKNVAYPLAARRMPKNEIHDRVMHMLHIVGIESLVEQHPGKMSGGQQQRVALARSLVAEPKVMLFDEPLSNVDARVRVQLRHEIAEMQLKLGFAGIYVTHDQDEAMQLADRLAVMEGGRVAQIDKPRAVYRRPSTHYVAQFIGEINRFAATTTAVDDDTVRFDVEGLGEVSASVSSTGSDVAVGRRVSVTARPESIELRPRGEARDGVANTWTGIVSREMFSGAHTDYWVTCENGVEMLVRSFSGETIDLEAGTAIAISIKPGGIRVLPALEVPADE